MSHNDEFVAGLMRGIGYAQEQVTAAGSDLKKLDPLKENFYQLIKLGLQFEETWRQAAKLALALFKYVEAKRYGNDLKPLLQSATSWCEAGDEQLHGRLLNRLGQLLRISKEPNQAQQTLHEALSFAEIANDLNLQGHICWNIASTIYWSNSKLKEAQDYALKALTLLQTVQSPKQGQVMNLLGLIVREQEDFDAAEKYFKQGIVQLEQARDLIDVGRVLNNLSRTYLLIGNYDAAIKTIEQLMELITHTDDHISLIAAYLNLGTIYANQKKYKQAAKVFSQIDTGFLEQIGNTKLLATTYNNLGYVQSQLGTYDSAEALLNESLTICKILDDHLIINVLDSLAILYEQTKRVRQAIAIYHEAIAFIEKNSLNDILKEKQTNFSQRIIYLQSEVGGQEKASS